ncbi:hypothetical protein BKA70DRAFT_1410662 [Coprinopsis sp. MPI-PUGE-AT-0042]|nr:hypothetical protein BKA70DRAFT_1410662 [Coprinopsis sp. MPI-PUGE-AT-0042]
MLIMKELFVFACYRHLVSIKTRLTLTDLTTVPLPAMKPPQVIPYLGNNNPLPEYLRQPLFSYLDHLASNINLLEDQERSLKRELQQVQEKLAKEREEGRRYFAGLRSVCSLWRRTAFSTRDLWKGLHVSKGDISAVGATEGANRKRQRKICSWFARAGTSDQNLVVALKPDVIGVQEIESYLSTLPCLSRLSISVKFPSAIASPEYLGSLPSLEDLYTINCAFRPTQSNSDTRITSQLVHPSLRHIAVAISHGSRQCVFNTSLLPRCPHLERISIRTAPDDDGYEQFCSTSMASLAQFVADSQLKDLTLDLTHLGESVGRDVATDIIAISDVGIRQLYIKEFWESDGILEKLVERGVAPPQVLVSIDPPSYWQEVESYGTKWLGHQLPFRKQLSSMKIYSPIPVMEGTNEPMHGVMELIHESGFHCTFLRQDEIDRMLGGVWDCVNNACSGHGGCKVEEDKEAIGAGCNGDELDDELQSSHAAALIKPPRVLWTDVLHGRITSPPLFTFPPEPPPDVSLEDTSWPLRLVFLPYCFYSPAFVRVPPLIVPLPTATPGFPIPPPPCPAVWCKFE